MTARALTRAGAADAVVVGAGPNGLAAAVALAAAGLGVTVFERNDEIGGGARSGELTLPGLCHDVCSAVHPMAAASPFLRSLPLEEHGLRWRWAEIELAHPLDGGHAAVLRRSLDATALGLGADGAAWRRLVGPHARRLDALFDDILRPVQHLPRHPAVLARFGAMALLPATTVARSFRADATRALFGGVAAHAFQPLGRATTSATALTLIAAGHRAGWPVAEGGSQAIVDALAGVLRSLGGTIETGVTVDSLRQLPPARVTLLDVAPEALIRIAGDELPARTRRGLARWRHGPAAFKLDLAVAGGIPWAAEECRRAGTVHLGGTIEEIDATETEVAHGRMPERPFVLVAQQYLADPGRSRDGVHPVWTYAHVPRGYEGDATGAVLGQLERFAPGAREHVVAVRATRPADLEAANPNLVGGDIASGACTPWQLLVRPRPALNPYATGIPGVYLCSAATPPAAGVHGMCGVNAAAAALRDLRHR